MLKILNASPGFGIPLTEQQTIDFMTTSKLNIHLGTMDENGHANIHPAWYIYDNASKRIYVETSKQAKKTQNIKKNENIYFCIDSPNPPYKGVRGKGIVKIHEEIKFNIPIAEKILVKYLGNTEHPMAQALLDMQRNGESVVLEINPKYYSTWDYSKNSK